MPDLNHGPSLAAGMVKRVAALMPPIDPVRLKHFRKFCKRFYEKFLKEFLEFNGTETFDFDEWNDNNSSYNEARKQELREIKKQYEDKPIDTTVDAFGKHEFNTDYKFPRGIFSRHDSYKCEVGPYFKQFGDRLFSTKWFIKKIPVSDRPAAILRKLDKFPRVFCTDFSQYESTFVKELLLIERMIYALSLKKHPQRDRILSSIDKMIQTNKINWKMFSCRLFGKRMSGEMNTSCGNGLMNLLITMYNCRRAGNQWHEIDAYFEGDDGEVGVAHLPTAQFYTDLGANIKIEIPEGIHTASFCGNVFHPDVLMNVTNPMEASAKFGWTKNDYLTASTKLKKKLLRCKSLSMLYEYPGCPILRELALYGIRVTDGEEIDFNFIDKHVRNTYERDLYVEMYSVNKTFELSEKVKKIEIDMRTRHLVEQLYGVTIEQQLQVERQLSQLNTLTELDLNLPFDRVWAHNDQHYTVTCEYYNKNLNFSKTGYTTKVFFNQNKIVNFNH